MYNTIYILIVCTLGGFKVTISYSRAVSFLQNLKCQVYTDRNLLGDSYWLVKYFQDFPLLDTELLPLMQSFSLKEVNLYSKSGRSGFSDYYKVV